MYIYSNLWTYKYPQEQVHKNVQKGQFSPRDYPNNNSTTDFLHVYTTPPGGKTKIIDIDFLLFFFLLGFNLL